LEQICRVRDSYSLEIKFKNFYLFNTEYLNQFLENLSFDFTLFEEEKKKRRGIFSFWQGKKQVSASQQSYKRIFELPGNQYKQTLFLDFTLMQSFQRITNSIFDYQNMNSIYSLILQENFYKAVQAEKGLRYD
jgi:hypothetical protein